MSNRALAIKRSDRLSFREISERIGSQTAPHWAALPIATIGVGHIPIMPASWASLLTTAGYFGFLKTIPRLYTVAVSAGLKMPQVEVFRMTCVLLLATYLGIVGIWASSQTERFLGRQDPKHVVIEEVVGQLITFVFVPLTAGIGGLVLGFLIFRAFDIFKPYPIRHLEDLHGGLVIMADDTLAGGYAAIVMLLLAYLPLSF